MENWRQLIILAQQGDKSAREELFQSNIPLVWSVVKRYQQVGKDPNDLFQAGAIGLLKSIDDFDTNYEVKFSTYAIPLILGEIRKYIREDTPVKVSRGMYEEYKIVKAILDQHEKRKEAGLEQGELSLSQMAKASGLSEENVLLALELGKPLASMEQVQHQGEGKPITLGETIPWEGKEVAETAVEKVALEKAMSVLTQEEKRYIQYRYFQGRTQTELTSVFCHSQVQLSRMEKKILQKLRYEMKENMV